MASDEYHENEVVSGPPGTSEERLPPPAQSPWGARDLGFFVAFFLFAAIVFPALALAVYAALRPFMGWRARAEELTTNPFFLVSIQSVSYALLLGYIYLLVVVKYRLRFWIGLNWFFLNNAPATYETTGVAFLAFWIFQFAFADTCSTITSGAMIGRTGFVGDLIYSVALILHRHDPFVCLGKRHVRARRLLDVNPLLQAGDELLLTSGDSLVVENTRRPLRVLRPTIGLAGQVRSDALEPGAIAGEKGLVVPALGD